jgi:hypothetical protein
MNCFECGKWQDVVYIVWQWKGCRARSCQCFSFALLMGMHVCSGRMGASMNSSLNLSVFTKLSNFDHVFLYSLFFAVHHLGPTLHELDLCHLSRKTTLFTTLFVSWDFVESYFQCWHPPSTLPSSAQRQVKFSHWMIPAYTSTKDIPSFHLCQALFTKTGRSAHLMSLV